MQPLDAVNTNTITTQPINPTNEHLEKLYSVYGVQMGLDRDRFLEFAMAHQASGGLLPSLPTNTIDGSSDGALPMASAFMQRARAAQNDQDYQDAMDTQVATQELETEQARAEDENRRAQAIAESQRIATEPKVVPETGESTFGQMIIRGGGSQMRAPQTNGALRGTAQKASFITGALRRFQMPKVPGGRK